MYCVIGWCTQDKSVLLECYGIHTHTPCICMYQRAYEELSVPNIRLVDLTLVNFWDKVEAHSDNNSKFLYY